MKRKIILGLSAAFIAVMAVSQTINPWPLEGCDEVNSPNGQIVYYCDDHIAYYESINPDLTCSGAADGCVTVIME